MPQVRHKCGHWVRGGVGGQFPKNLNWPILIGGTYTMYPVVPQPHWCKKTLFAKKNCPVYVCCWIKESYKFKGILIIIII